MSSLRHVEHCLARQSAYKHLNAFIILPKAAVLRAAAGKADSTSSTSSLHGRLISLKENIASSPTNDASSPSSQSETGHNLTTCDTSAGSRALAGYISPITSTVADRLATAGAIVQGKTTMDEFGMGSHTQTGYRHGARSSLSYARTGDDPCHISDTAKSIIIQAASQESSNRSWLSPGGSSGGAALAVLTGQCFAALGTDTGGSVRLPAAWTGTVGFKGSYGRVSRYGVVDYAHSMDTVGVLARRVQDVQGVWRAIDGVDARDATCLSSQTRERIEHMVRSKRKEREPRGLRIGVPHEWNVEGLQACVRKAWERTLEKLKDEGCTLVPVALPTTRLALAAYYILAPAEASSNLARYDGVRYGSRADSTASGTWALPFIDGVETKQTSDSEHHEKSPLYATTRAQAFGPEVQRRILLGAYTLSSDAMDNFFLQAQRVRRLICEDFDRVFAMRNVLRPEKRSGATESRQYSGSEVGQGVDVLLTPTAPTLPPRLADLQRESAVEKYAADVLTVPSSLAGLPAMSVPVPLEPQTWRGRHRGDEVPGQVDSVGMQVIGQFGDDELVMRVGEMVQDLWV